MREPSFPAALCLTSWGLYDPNFCYPNPHVPLGLLVMARKTLTTLSKAEIITLEEKVRVLAISGTTQYDIAKQLDVPVTRVRDVVESESYKDLVRVMGDNAVATAKNYLKVKAESLVQDVWKTIEKLVRDPSVKANAEGIRAYFRLIGLDKPEDGSGMQHLTIQLPGISKPETVIEVVDKEKEDEN